MGIHIVYVCGFQTGHLKCLLHSQICPFAILRRGRLVEGVTGIAIATQKSVDWGLAPAGMFL